MPSFTLVQAFLKPKCTLHQAGSENTPYRSQRPENWHLTTQWKVGQTPLDYTFVEITQPASLPV